MLAQDGIVEKLQSCPLCSGTSFRELPTPGHWTGEETFSVGVGAFGLLRCQDCSLAFTNPRPAPALLTAFYNRDTYACHSAEGGDAASARFLMDCVDRHGPYRGNRFLDFGCGGGFLLRAAEARNWNAIGFEVGQRGLDSCQAQGLKATGNLAELETFSFDVVFLNHVFEHVAEQEGLLFQCRRLLEKHGKLFVVVPNLTGMRARLSLPLLSRFFNIDERYRAFPSHLFYFTRQTLARTLEKNGFRVTGSASFGLGMEAFIKQPQSTFAHAPANRANSRPKSSVTNNTRPLRQMIKNSLYSAGLGENLLAVAEPI